MRGKTGFRRLRRGAIWLSGFALAVGCIFVTLHVNALVHNAIVEGSLGRMTEIIITFGIIYWMFATSFTYLIAIYAYEKRIVMSSRPGGIGDAEVRNRERIQPLLFLIPSYKEEEVVIRRALMSAALVEYSRKRVVLLIDDSPNPTTESDSEALARSRRLPCSMQKEFDKHLHFFETAQRGFEERWRVGEINPADEIKALASLYQKAADRIESQSEDFCEGTHTNRLFVNKILKEPARLHRQRAEWLLERFLTLEEIADEYRRLATLFRVEFSSFERKRYENLSHAPNKAMNLNSYIALIGKTFREVQHQSGLVLEECESSDGTIYVPVAPYIATIDADSFVTWDFALQLVQVMEKSGNERIAVAQTPYTAISGAPTCVERAAAASTDVQFVTHLGMASFGASWWVGASALMRHAALEDIAIEEQERGHRIKIYIRDKILIEDAAATIDLANKGWSIYHNIGRLSYSETPPDFGSLIIQRHRWSNGGLLIVPQLLRYVFGRPWRAGKFREGLLRMQFLLSATISGAGYMILLFGRFDDDLIPMWMPVVMVPYFLMYGSELVRAGYGWIDLARVYTLTTILLVPAYIAGTMHSIGQAFSGTPVRFKRTPKVATRTAVPSVYLAVLCGFVLWCLGSAISDLSSGRHTHALFSIINSVVTMYGFAYLIGFRDARDDFVLGIRLLYRLGLNVFYRSIRRLSIGEEAILSRSGALARELVAGGTSTRGTSVRLTDNS
jgi:cellulose synthase (UDP-forming)